MQIQYPFRLSGKINNFWSQVTNNQWKNMLPKHWTDKGFHFYNRIVNRGPKVGINTPADLSSEINNGTVVHDAGARFKILTNILSDKGQRFTIFYDFDHKKKQCQLVTCSFT